MNGSNYRRIADDLRAQIQDGRLPPGSRVPSRAQLAQQYGVSDRVAVEAVRLLTAEGLVAGKPGSGTYVRESSEMRRIPRSVQRGQQGGSPFGGGAATEDGTAVWRPTSSSSVRASDALAARLVCDRGADLVSTEYVLWLDDRPVMLATSWEPLALTRGTPIRFPEEGPHAGRGVVERMAVIGLTVTEAVENVTARPVLLGEAKLLGAPRGSVVVVIQRTYMAGERPVETADIVVPTDRYEVSYTIPVGED